MGWRWRCSRQSPVAEPDCRVTVQRERFDLAAEVATLCARHPQAGALCTLTGMVRDHETATQPGQTGAVALTALELEHHPVLTERVLTDLMQDACRRWPLLAVRVVHRVGRLEVQEPIVLVAVLSAHRRDAFLGCEFLMDALKTQAPFWKKAHTAAGAYWIEARTSDDVAAARWGLAPQL